MECIYKNISLDIHDDITSQLSLSVKQGDTARGIRVSLTDHGKVFNIPDSCYAVFSARKGNGIFISDGCVIQNNTIIYNFSDTVVSVATQIDCELIVYSEKGDKITSPSFMIFVYKTLEEEYAGEVVESNSFTVLNDLISTATEVISNVNEATEKTTAIAEEIQKETEDAIAKAAEATEQARASVVNIKKTEDGKLQLLDAENNVIDIVDVCYMDNDTIYRYDNGVLRVVGIKEINADETFRMWVGTTKQWQALSEYDDNTFYWITDDATFDEVVEAINALNESFTELENALKSGELVVGKANEADSANTADHADTATSLSFIEIGNRANLDDYCPPKHPFGDYICAANAVVGTLSNCPTTEAFFMSVRSSGAGARQELTTYSHVSPRKYFRNYYDDLAGGGWGDWVVIPQRVEIGRESEWLPLISNSDGLLVLNSVSFSVSHLNVGDWVEIDFWLRDTDGDNLIRQVARGRAFSADNESSAVIGIGGSVGLLNFMFTNNTTLSVSVRPVQGFASFPETQIRIHSITKII